MSTAEVHRIVIPVSFINKLLKYDRELFFPLYREWVQRQIDIARHLYSRPVDRDWAYVESRCRFLRKVSNAL